MSVILIGDLTPRAIFFRMSILRFRSILKGRNKQRTSVKMSIKEVTKRNAVRVY